MHVVVRWWSCPFPAVETHVPAAGRILEIGAGHGLLSLYLGLSSPGRRVIGIDIDERKIELARAAATHLRPGEADVRFELVRPDALPEGPFDAVVIADVVYLLAEKERRSVLERAAAALPAAGVLVLKETDHRVRGKSFLTTAQERLATGLGVTAGEHVDFPTVDELADILGEQGLTVEHVPMHHGYLHPHHLLLARRPPHPAA
jgi:2-polyprenyl-3-methyl-5-hydroxy-6-metoxy-1,4-benzoquinol methylase